jgi:outer membrane beta-barrel protein
MRKLTASALTWSAAVLVAAGVFVATEHEARAQEIVLTGPLKGAPPVKRLRLYRENRFEIAPLAAFTLLDEYQHSYFIGGRVTYYFTDWIGVGLWGGYALNTDTDLTSQIDKVAPRDTLTVSNVAPCTPSDATAASTCPGGNPRFSDQTAKLTWAVFGQITAVPFRGKLALFQALFVDTEAYLFLGAGAVGVDERANCGDTGQPSCNDKSSFVLASTPKFAPTFGLGLTFFLNDIVNLGVEYRALPFSWNRGGFDSRGLGPNNNFPDGKVNGDDETFKFNQVIGVSVGVMLGGRKISK